MKTMNEHFKLNNILAGLIVAVVALPLCIAFAIASGAHPMAGIISGVLGGLIAALFGSSRFQVSGPAAAFITIIYGIIASHGVTVLLASTFLAGVVVLLIALFRLGRLMELMPHSIIAGFTCGIGILILLSQWPVALGIDAKGEDIVAKMLYTFSHIDEAKPAEPLLLAITLLTTVLYSRTRLVRWVPAPLVALAAGGVFGYLLEANHLPVSTIGEMYHVSLRSLSASASFLGHFSVLTDEQLAEVLIAGVTLGLLIALETLLSSRALDAMTRSTHDPNRELVGHGLANLAVPFLGGLPVSGVIVRGSTNVMAGATAKSSSVLHAVFLAAFIALLFPLVGMLPLVSLAAVLILTAKRLIDLEESRRIFRINKSEGLLAIATALLTVTIDLTVAVPAGVGAMLILALRRMINEKQIDIVERGEGSSLLVESSVTFLNSAPLRDEIARHLSADDRVRRVHEIDLTNSRAIDVSGALMLAELLVSHPDVCVVVASGERMLQLRHAGIREGRIVVRGNRVVDMPSVYRGIRASPASEKSLPHRS